MKLLLDTHIWLWSVMEPKRLSRRVVRILSAPDNEVWISPVSTWEILVLSAKGRLALEPNAHEWIAESIARASFREAPLTQETIPGMQAIELSHRDPADWFLAATARNFDLTLVTSDRNLIGGRGYSVLANE